MMVWTRSIKRSAEPRMVGKQPPHPLRLRSEPASSDERFMTADSRESHLSHLEARWRDEGDKSARDLWLLHRWRDGDREAGATLLGSYKKLVHRLCRNFGVRGEEAIVEIFQNVVLVAVRDLLDLPERITKSFSGWLSWQVRDAVTRWRREHRSDVAVTEALPSEIVAPSRQLELWEIIRSCSGQLPAGEARVFELRYVQGLSLKETADILKSNPNAVGQSIFRLSRKMRTCLAHAGIDEEF